MTASGIARERAGLHDWLPLVRGEYEELPALRLTRAQVEELWELAPGVAEALLGVLVSAGAVRKTDAGEYVGAHTPEWR
jgi:hypothetical protein